MFSQTYPVQIRSLQKAVPCLVMCYLGSWVFYVATYAFVKHEHDHIPKFSYR